MFCICTCSICYIHIYIYIFTYHIYIYTHVCIYIYIRFFMIPPEISPVLRLREQQGRGGHRSHQSRGHLGPSLGATGPLWSTDSGRKLPELGLLGNDLLHCLLVTIWTQGMIHNNPSNPHFHPFPTFSTSGSPTCFLDVHGFGAPQDLPHERWAWKVWA